MLHPLMALAFFVVVKHSKTLPAGEKPVKIKVSGKPTYFEVDDTAKKLEIDAKVTEVKMNNKPASLHVLSKRGTPSLAIAYPLMYATPESYHMAQYGTAPTYFHDSYHFTSPPLLKATDLNNEHKSRKRLHHNFDTSDNDGNLNSKKKEIPKRMWKTSKSYGRSFKKSNMPDKPPNMKTTPHIQNLRKRQWIQSAPTFVQVAPYNVLPIQINPSVQRYAEARAAAMRNTIPGPFTMISPQLLSPQLFSPWNERYLLTNPTLSYTNGAQRSSIGKAIFTPGLSTYGNLQRVPPLVMPTTPASVSNPLMFQNSLLDFGAYYKPILAQNFIPDYRYQSYPKVQAPISRTIIPTGITRGLIYPSYTSLAQLPILSKRLKIPHGKHDETGSSKSLKSSLQTPTKRLKRATQKFHVKNMEIFGKNKWGESDEKSKTERESIPHPPVPNAHKDTKRQFILTQPMIEPRQQPIVAYVPILPSPQTDTSPLTVPQNLVLTMPEMAQKRYLMYVPKSPQMYIPREENYGGFSRFKQYGAQPDLLASIVGMANTRSGIIPRRTVQNEGRVVTLGDLSGIMGTPIVRRGSPFTMSYNHELPSMIEDELFQDRYAHPWPITPDVRSYIRENDLDTRFADDYGDYRRNVLDMPESYVSPVRFTRIQDKGSYTERLLPDDRIIFRKNKVASGPITVEAKTAEIQGAAISDNTAFDMNLDSDKRKQIARPENERILDRRIKVPRP